MPRTSQGDLPRSLREDRRPEQGSWGRRRGSAEGRRGAVSDHRSGPQAASVDARRGQSQAEAGAGQLSEPLRKPRGEHKVSLSAAQSQIFRSKRRHRVVVAGRRFGKTYNSIVECLSDALAGPYRRSWYITPTYRQGKEIAWSDLKTICGPFIRSKHETELRVTFWNGSEIAIRGADDPDKLRGPGLDFAVLDEYADMDPEAWAAVISPMLADRLGRALFIGTPKGWNHFKDLYDAALTDPEWERFKFTTLEGGRVPASEIESQRRHKDIRTFRQEFEASFETLAGRVYYAFDGELNLARVEDAGGPIRIGMDFNVDPMTAVVGSRVADQLFVWDEITIRNSNTREMVREIRSRYGEREIIVYPDPSGKARKTSAEVGVTDFAILAEAGFEVRAPNVAGAIKDRVNEVNSLACTAAGDRRLYVNPRCVMLRKTLEGRTYKEGTSIPDKENGIDHPGDALEYIIDYEFPINDRIASIASLRI